MRSYSLLGEWRTCFYIFLTVKIYFPKPFIFDDWVTTTLAAADFLFSLHNYNHTHVRVTKLLLEWEGKNNNESNFPLPFLYFASSQSKRSRHIVVVVFTVSWSCCGWKEFFFVWTIFSCITRIRKRVKCTWPYPAIRRARTTSRAPKRGTKLWCWPPLLHLLYLLR